MYIVTINPTDAGHLAKVIEEMHVLGAPKLRAYKDEAQGVTVALEGSHRVAAAIALGLEIEWDYLDGGDLVACSDIGFDDCGWFDGEPARVEDVVARIAAPSGTYDGCPIYRVAE